MVWDDGETGRAGGNASGQEAYSTPARGDGKKFFAKISIKKYLNYIFFYLMKVLARPFVKSILL